MILFGILVKTNANTEFQIEKDMAEKMGHELSRLLGNGEQYIVRVDLQGTQNKKPQKQFAELPLGGGKVAIENISDSYDRAFQILSANIQVFVNQELTEESELWIKNYLGKHPFVSSVETRVDVLYNIPKNIVKNELKVAPAVEKDEAERMPASLDPVEKEPSSIKVLLEKLGLNHISDNEVVAIFNLASSIIIVIGVAAIVFLGFMIFSLNSAINKKKEMTHTSPAPPPLPPVSTHKDLSPPPVPLESINQTWKDHDMWSKFSRDALVLGLYDLASDERHVENVPLILGQFVPSDYYQAVEAEFKDYYFSGNNTVDLAESIKLLMNNLAEYNHLAKEKIPLKCIHLSSSTVDQIIQNLSGIEIIALFTKITPVKKEILLNELSIHVKVKIMQLDSSKLTDEVYTKATAKMNRFVDTIDEEVISSHNKLNRVKEEITKANSFEEDSIFYQSDHKDYLSPLSLLNEEYIEKVPLRTLALAYYGYSDEIITQLADHFDPDSKKWLLSFIEQYQGENPGWNHSMVEQARKQLLNWKKPIKDKLSIAA